MAQATAKADGTASDSHIATDKNNGNEDPTQEEKVNKANDGKILADDVKSSNFKDYLIHEGFTQFGNLESDYGTAKLTFDDIVGMNEADLEKMLINDYKVKVAQKNRFIKAMKKLPESKASESNGM